MKSLSTLATRVSLVYFAYFFFLGINTPYAASWLAARGFGAWVGILLGASLIAKTAGQPTLSYLADLSGRRAMLILSAAAAAVTTLALVFSFNYFVVLTLLVLAGFFIGPILPLTDALTLSDESLNYGHVRLWGSLGFAVANMGGGILIDRLGIPLVIWLEVGGLAILLLITLALPKRSHQHDSARTPQARAAANKQLGQFMIAPMTWLFIISISVLNASHAYYYVFSVRYWAEVQHFSKLTTGVLWAIGVVAEVSLLWVIGDQVPLKRAKQLMVLAGIGGVIRWSLTALAPPFLMLVPLQMLHAFTYAAMHLGSMMVLRRAVPPQIATAVMGIYAAAVNGVVIGIVTSQLDPVYALLGAQGYLIMAALSMIGGLGVIVFSYKWQGGLFCTAPQP
jgi:PPP family 3-phenylpropionic acid transporter